MVKLMNRLRCTDFLAQNSSFSKYIFQSKAWARERIRADFQLEIVCRREESLRWFAGLTDLGRSTQFSNAGKAICWFLRWGQWGWVVAPCSMLYLIPSHRLFKAWPQFIFRYHPSIQGSQTSEVTWLGQGHPRNQQQKMDLNSPLLVSSQNPFHCPPVEQCQAPSITCSMLLAKSLNSLWASDFSYVKWKECKNFNGSLRKSNSLRRMGIVYAHSRCSESMSSLEPMGLILVILLYIFNKILVVCDS